MNDSFLKKVRAFTLEYSPYQHPTFYENSLLLEKYMLKKSKVNLLNLRKSFKKCMEIINVREKTLKRIINKDYHNYREQLWGSV